MIELKRISKRYQQNAAYSVDSVSLRVLPGETMILLGSSGSGKTTLLKMINRLIEPSSGEILIDGQNILNTPLLPLRRSIGYVFQKIGLFPHMTVLENMTLQLKLSGATKRERNQRAFELLEFVNLTPNHYAQRYPDELSGGQQQRIGVARALMTNPNILLMDEPFGALDAVTRDNLQKEFSELIKQLKKTVVFVTHDIFEALRLGDKIAIMHQGRLQQVSAPSVLMREQSTPFVKSMISKIKTQVATFSEDYQEEMADA